MTYFIPVFFLPTSIESLGDDPEEVAYQLVGDAADNREQSRLREATSTNWWHVVTVQGLATAWGVAGFEFLASPVQLLRNDESVAVVQGVTSLLNTLASDTLPAPTAVLDQDPDYIQHAELRAAIPSAQPSFVVDEDSGHVHSFIQFLVSMRDAAQEAVARNQRLLYFQPQP